MKNLLLAIVATLFLLPKTNAQTPVSTADTIQEITVSGRFSELKRNVPNQIRTISPQEIARTNAPNTADLLSSTGEIFAQKSQQGGGSPTLRGLEANRILLVLDGVRLNNAIFRGGHLQNVLRIDQFSLDHAEVIGGPGALVYGSDALGGVLHFLTQKPLFSTDLEGKLQKKGSAVVRYGTAAREKTAHFDLNLGAKKWASYTSVSFSDFDDLRQGDVRSSKFPEFGKRLFSQQRSNGKDSMVANNKPNVQLGSGFWQANVLQKFEFQSKPTVKHGLTFLFTTTGNVPRYDRLSEIENGLPRSAEWYYGPEKWFLANYKVHFLPQHSNMANEGIISAAFQKIEESRHSRSWGSQNRKNQVESVAVFSVNADFRKVLGDHQIKYGVELIGNKVDSKSTKINLETRAETAADTRYPDGGSTLFSAAAFVANNYQITEKLNTNFGVRYTFSSLSASFLNFVVPFPFNDVVQNNGALVGNLGFNYFPSNSLKISVLGSTGYRTPNVDDIGKVFESVTKSQLIVPNPDLRPEYVWNAESTIETIGNGAFSGSVTGYAMWLTDVLGLGKTQFEGADSVLYDGNFTPVFSMQNLGRARIFGFTTRLGFALNYWLKASGTLNFTKGDILDAAGNSPLDHIPPTMARLGLAASKMKWNAEIFTLINGKKSLKNYRLGAEDNEKYATTDGTLAWWTLNLRGGYQISDKIEIQAAAENLLDKNYRPFSSGLSAAGRDFRVTIRAGF